MKPFVPVLFVLFATGLITLSNAQGDFGVWKDGAKATYYGNPDGSGANDGACGYGVLKNTEMGANFVAQATPLWFDGLGCGSCYEIRCVNNQYCNSGATAKVTVTDLCPGGDHCCSTCTHFDLSEIAFAKIANQIAGVIPIQYRRVACTYSTNIMIEALGHPWWLSILFRNVGGAGDLSSVQVKRKTDSSWMNMRHDWGSRWLFEPGGNLANALSFRLTTRYDNYSIILTDCLPFPFTENTRYTCNSQIFYPPTSSSSPPLSSPPLSSPPLASPPPSASPPLSGTPPIASPPPTASPPPRAFPPPSPPPRASPPPSPPPLATPPPSSSVKYGVWKSGASATYMGRLDGTGTELGSCGYRNLSLTAMKLNVAGASPPIFKDGMGCGSCYEVKCVNSPYCKSGKVTKVTIVDACTTIYPECCPTCNHFVLSQYAFNRIAQVSVGRVPLQYRRVLCTYSTKIIIEAEGDLWWLSVLVRNLAGAGDIGLMQAKRPTDINWINMTHSWGANWVFNPQGSLTSSLSFRITTLYDKKTVVLNNCLPYNFIAKKQYVCSSQI